MNRVLHQQDFKGQLKTLQQHQTTSFQRGTGTSREIPACFPFLCPPPQYRWEHSTQAARHNLRNTKNMDCSRKHKDLMFSFICTSPKIELNLAVNPVSRSKGSLQANISP